MKLRDVHNVYFLGIGGIGMSALARWFKHNGKAVSGYDKTPTPLTRQLENEGIAVHFEDDPAQISSEVKASKADALVIYTPAIPKGHKEWAWLMVEGFTIMKRSQVLGLITESMISVAVAGTHGKTTTSSMIVHLMKTAGIDCTGFLGGIATNYGTNMVMNEETNSIAVIEADEFDRSFLTLRPDAAVVTSIDADHLDIYGDKDALKESFALFVSKIEKKGKLFAKQGVGSQILVDTNRIHHSSYALESADITAENLRIEEAAFVFDYKTSKKTISGIRLNVPGFHNVENALAAISVTKYFGADDDSIREGISTYKGVKRRFEYIIKSAGLVYIDDYAHHPVEIESLLKSVRALYPSKRISAVFQPHLFSRTRDFAPEFSQSLSLADEVILLDIYPAREQPIEGITSEMLLEKVNAERKIVCTKEALLEQIKAWQPEVLLTIGAGDIDKFVEPIKAELS
ncbi:UDP-N-acetylmuramate--L-alanine ligase [Roseivirga echinicomitans]|nr:UDP-N-acetylmuramate--L-alanine ligase [Roseivirga echinicomitans]